MKRVFLMLALPALLCHAGPWPVPATFRGFHHPGVTLVPVTVETAPWALLVLWQRGRAPAALTHFLEVLAAHVQALQ